MSLHDFLVSRHALHPLKFPRAMCRRMAKLCRSMLKIENFLFSSLCHDMLNLCHGMMVESVFLKIKFSLFSHFFQSLTLNPNFLKFPPPKSYNLSKILPNFHQSPKTHHSHPVFIQGLVILGQATHTHQNKWVFLLFYIIRIAK